MSIATIKYCDIFSYKGANSGIGYSCALEIAKRKGTVHLVCRNEKLGTEAKEKIMKSTQNENVHLHIVDMSLPNQIVAFIKKFSEENKKLDVLVI